MGNWRRWRSVFGFDREAGGDGADRHAWLHEEERALLPSHLNEQIESGIPPAEVTKVCLRLRHLIRECIPCELEESAITKSNSTIITRKVIKAAQESGGEKYKGCVVYALLVNKRWFQHEAVAELWDADLHNVRAVACTVIAKQMRVPPSGWLAVWCFTNNPPSIENEEDNDYLMQQVLLRRYSFIVDGVPTSPVNVIEKAVDLHAVRVIGSSGYQKCINYLWRGWLIQDENDPSVFVDYKDKDNRNFLVHMDPDRMRAPRYQNAAQVLFSFIYLALYTAAINSVNPTGILDGAEVALYVFTAGYVADECVKFYKAGYRILGFWNALNGTLYTFLTASLIVRIIGLSHHNDQEKHDYYNHLSYNMLSFSAPMFWARLLLYLDSFRFFGAMLVVIKVMMKESAIFFALLIILIIGFLQAFIGLDLTDDNVAGDVWFIIESMLKAIMQSPEFEGFENFGHPWGLILYYCFTFVVMIILLNVLIALYNSAYEDIYENADDEYLALFAQKTMQFVRAPDENVYIAPFNLVEIFISGLLEWWMNKTTYEFINDCAMGVLYSPLLLVAAYLETRTAYDIRRNRARGEEDDDTVHEWEQLAHEMDFESEGWAKTCQIVKPNVEDDPAVVEVRRLRQEVDELKAMLAEVSKAVGAGVTAVTSQVDEEAEESTSFAPQDPQDGKSDSSSSNKKKKQKKKKQKKKSKGGSSSGSQN